MRQKSFYITTYKQVARDLGYDEGEVKLCIDIFFMGLKKIMENKMWFKFYGFFKFRMRRRVFIKNLMNGKLDIAEKFQKIHEKNKIKRRKERLESLRKSEERKLAKLNNLI